MDWILAHCAEAFPGRVGLYLAFFLGGLTGGFTHCLSMCGPLAACSGLCSRACSLKPSTISVRSALGYHLGRLATYSILGGIVAALAGMLTALSWWPALASGMLAAAGLLFLYSCLTNCHGMTLGEKGAFMRGVLLGFLPCGLLYAALMMAATLAHPLKGMVAMALFAIGTMPALMLTQTGVFLISQRAQTVMQSTGRALMAYNGLLLLVMAARLMRSA